MLAMMVALAADLTACSGDGGHGRNHCDETEREIAENMIHHAGDRASHIVLPVMERGG